MNGEQTLAKLLPPDVCVAAVLHSAARAAPELLPAERAAVAKAVASRREEFAWGRSCARRALTLLGYGAPPIPVAADRAPVWPEGVVGSITHCEGFVAAAVSEASLLKGLGIDVELAAPLAREEAEIVCSDREMRAPDAAHGLRAKLLFSAKEAFHKCVAPQTGVTLEFRDVSIEVDEAGSGFRVVAETEASRRLGILDAVEGRFCRTPNHVMTAAWVHA